MLEATIGSKTKTVEFEVKNKQHQLTHLVNFNEKNFNSIMHNNNRTVTQ